MDDRNRHGQSSEPLTPTQKEKNVKKLWFQLIKRISGLLSCFFFGVILACLILPSATPWGICLVVFLMAGLGFTLLGLQIAKLCTIWPFERAASPPQGVSKDKKKSPELENNWLNMNDIKKMIEAFNDSCDELEQAEIEQETPADVPIENAQQDRALEKERKIGALTLKKPKRLLPTNYLSKAHTVPEQSSRSRRALFPLSLRT